MLIKSFHQEFLDIHSCLFTGAINDCSGATFFIEDHLRNLVLQPTSNTDEEVIESCEPDTKGVTPNKYRDLSEEQYHLIRQQEMTRAEGGCSTQNILAVGTAMDEVQNNSNAAAIQALGQRSWKRAFEYQFDPSKIELCFLDFPNNGELLRQKFVQQWLDIDLSTGMCLYSCYYCKLYFTLNFRADLRHKSQICTEKGYHGPTRVRIKETV